MLACDALSVDVNARPFCVRGGLVVAALSTGESVAAPTATDVASLSLVGASACAFGEPVLASPSWPLPEFA